MRFLLSKPDAGILALVAALWWTAVYLTGPAGSIPLGDDWSFARAAFGLAAGEGYRPPDWAAMTLVVHALWGALLAALFGLDFVSLRGGMLALAIGCGFLLWYGLRRAGTPRAITTLTVAALLFNPLFFALSHSFMTDVTFIALLVAQAFCLMKCADTLAWRWIGWSSATTVLAALTRDPGVLPAAVLCAVIFAERRDWSAARAAIPLVAGVLAVAVFRHWARHTGIDLSHSVFFRDVLVFSIRGLGWRDWLAKTYSALLYSGLFTLPLLLPVAARLWREGGRVRQRACAGFAVGFAFLAGAFFLSGNHFPPEAGWMNEAGFLGHPLLYDVSILHVSDVPRIPHWMVDLATAAAVTGGALLLGALTALGLLPRRKRRWAVFCALTAVATNIHWVLMTVYFDRYALPGVLLLLVLCALFLAERPAPRWAMAAGAALALLFGLWGIAGVHDLFEWQRARWRGLEYLTGKLQIPPARIDGGFEFNAWHVEKHPIPYPEYAFAERHIDVPTDRSWWWVGDPEYMVAFGTVPGYRVIATFPYERWMPGRSDWAIHVLRRAADVPR